MSAFGIPTGFTFLSRNGCFPTFWEFVAIMEAISWSGQRYSNQHDAFKAALARVCLLLGIQPPTISEVVDLQAKINTLGVAWKWWEPVKKVTQSAPTTSILPLSQELDNQRRLAQGIRDLQMQAQAAGQQQASFPVIKKYVTKDELEQTPHTYVLRNMAESSQPIMSIKYIREVTGWGLKESKSYWDTSEYAQIYDEAHAKHVKMTGNHTSGYQPTLGQRILSILNEPYSLKMRCDKIRNVAQYYESLR